MIMNRLRVWKDYPSCRAIIRHYVTILKRCAAPSWNPIPEHPQMNFRTLGGAMYTLLWNTFFKRWQLAVPTWGSERIRLSGRVWQPVSVSYNVRVKYRGEVSYRNLELKRVYFLQVQESVPGEVFQPPPTYALRVRPLRDLIFFRGMLCRLDLNILTERGGGFKKKINEFRRKRVKN